MIEENTQNLLSHIKFRLAGRADLAALEWDGELKHYKRLFAEIYRQKEQGLALIWLTEIKGVGVIGQLFVQLSSARRELADGINKAYIYGFRVRSAYQGKGIGTRLMEIVEQDLLGRGFSIVSLNVSQDNEGALRLYNRLGYHIIGPDPGRWSYVDHKGNVVEVNEPAWRMQKALK